jgi:hypothetical protein
MKLPDWLTVAGVLLTLLFGVASVVFFLRSRRHKQLAFVYGSTVLQTRAYSEVAISYRGNAIENLSRLTVVCWNSGTKEIRRTDFPQTGFPSVTFSDNARILATRLLRVSSASNAVSIVEVSPTELRLALEYLNPNDGGVIEILYENPDGIPMPFEFAAEVIGALPTRVSRYATETSLASDVTTLIASIFIAGSGVMSLVTTMQSGWKGFTPQFVFSVLAFPCALGILALDSVPRLRRRVSSRVPSFGLQWVSRGQEDGQEEPSRVRPSLLRDRSGGTEVPGPK